MPSGDEMLRQIEGMVFRDESAGKTLDPTESTKKDRTKKPKRKKRKKKKEEEEE